MGQMACWNRVLLGIGVGNMAWKMISLKQHEKLSVLLPPGFWISFGIYKLGFHLNTFQKMPMVVKFFFFFF